MNETGLKAELDQLKIVVDEIRERIPPKWLMLGFGTALMLIVSWGVWVTSTVFNHDGMVFGHEARIAEIVELRKDIGDLRVKVGVLIDRLERSHSLSSQRTTSPQDN